MKNMVRSAKRGVKGLLSRVGVGQERLEGWRRLLQKDHFAAETRFVANVDGIETVFSAEDPYSHTWFYPRYGNGLIHEPIVTSMIVNEVRNATCFLDIGANLGWFSCIAASHMPSGSVLAFEMDAANFALLKQNAALNGFTNVSAVNAAVADEAGTVTYSRPNDRPSAFYQLQGGHSQTLLKNAVTVPAVTIDEYLQTHQISPEVVKIDVEGAEMRVLKGMEQFLRQHKPVIFLEIHPSFLPMQDSTADEVLQFLADCGYEMAQIEAMRGNVHAARLTALTPGTPIFANDMLLCRHMASDVRLSFAA